jgi:S-adenosylmethionine hydrolase
VTLRWASDVRTARRARTYGDLAGNEVGLVIDSYGLLSIAVSQRSAAAELRLRPGDTVTLEAAQ